MFKTFFKSFKRAYNIQNTLQIFAPASIRNSLLIQKKIHKKIKLT